MDKNKKIEETLQSWDNKSSTKAPNSLKNKILEQVQYVRQEAKIVPMTYYYRAAIAASLLLCLNVFALNQPNKGGQKSDEQQEFVNDFFDKGNGIF